MFTNAKKQVVILLPLVLLVALFGALAPLPALASEPRRGFTLETAVQPIEETLADIEAIADLGGTVVRFPCYLWANPDITYWLPRIFETQAVCQRRNLILAVTFHVPPQVFQSRQGRTYFVDCWRAVAECLANRPGRVWYELANEPDHPQWPDIALRAAQAIRRHDSRRAIAYSARGVTTDPAGRITPLPGISNQVIVFHYYDWPDVQFTMDSYPRAGRTREILRQRLERVADAGRRNGVRVYISEVAIFRDHPNAPRFLRDFTSICDDLNIHLTVHSFREADVWDYEKNPAAWNVLKNWLAD